ncbi:ribonucleotide-diphosphate reductase subunit beta [Verrucomicrobiaceae bacterium N1E253]|uniref:ribonucleoside-diphosphate reductase n=1 Tax=Oceaniferula marina TaxID=2748318 RepID=A0A851GR94_9BACT|nr:ribonucleotide-diphosphate reductase subunit beta [Oceaniferula marina]NWK57517.1 ribonucleotide-diphosphate reductase subunit beta [Oceaniferula marina]
MADTITITLGDRSFELDREKAEEAYSAKKVINGRKSMFFNILPLKYQWAYDLYKEMKNEHWEPAETTLRDDLAQWSRLDESSQSFVKLALGAFARAQEIFHSDEIYTVRDLLTAPELKLVFGRFVHEENTRNDVLVYLHGALSINPMECGVMASKEVINAKAAFMDSRLSPVDRNTDTTVTENKQAIVRNIFLINQCMEGTQFYSIWAGIFSLAMQNKLPGKGRILSYLLRDVAFRIRLFDKLIKEMVEENPDLWTAEFKDELAAHMKDAVKLEQELIASLPISEVGLDADVLGVYIEYLADERLAACGLARQYFHSRSPYPWLDEQIHLASAHEGHSSTATLDTSFEDDDL